MWRNQRDGDDPADDLAAEQRYVAKLYRKLDEERQKASRELDRALTRAGSTPWERTERDVSATMYRERLAQLDGVEAGLCFGRLDNTDGETIHIGRIGLLDEDGDYEPLLVDWRAPVARPFYLATAASPQGVRRRRHLRLRLRNVVDIDDEILDLDAEDSGRDLGLAGEAALLAALNRQRGEHMRDIVDTTQAEQDRIIRAPAAGVLVVQGGPGTGKTAVALHRVAYLLYEHRESLSSRGVLVLGPNTTFLHYIGQVLPSLGETGVLLATMGDLFPGIRVRSADSREGGEIKGRTAMVDVLAAAVASRQRVPDEPLTVHSERDTLVVDPETVAAARAKARASGKPHNLARRVFRETLLAMLAEQAAHGLATEILDGVPDIGYTDDEDPDTELLDRQDVADIRDELAREEAVQRVLDWLWPEYTPQQLLGELLTDREDLARAAGEDLSATEIDVIVRSKSIAWTPADVPLLDELAELLGEDDSERRARAEHAEREERAYAEGVLHVLEQDDELADEERLRVADILDAELLAERERERSELTAAQRAAADRSWTFGHVVIDEAQELSAMDWRLIMRRCPNRSMTVVGDVAQTSASAGASSWAEVLEPYVATRWRLAELTVNYRTPAEIAEVAATVLARFAPAMSRPLPVRHAGNEPWQVELAGEPVESRLPDLVAAELSMMREGTLGVLCPRQRQPELSSGLSRGMPGTQDGADRVSLLTVEQAKGLEFDEVVVVAPDEIAVESERGLNDLYVALTRATQRLGVVHPGTAGGGVLDGVIGTSTHR
ncbi:UvrD-helicase domain-containing protein [Haloechinothrix sp. LS1_15]|uniref:UvrD-helicase domain-containing protein n=1 Tax=Haloechinothrix sp. LS1_15 TaxID=2652248 RepID=UPI0029473AA5|nr:UvrD-helicase domain-containing protein [Haloechinothrix sp. LS1_15]MDV6013230.1 helicase [Haloechinothrix sp. LS1_15]